MGLIDSSITYTGKESEGFYSTALLTGNTKSIIRLIPNVKDKVKIASLDMGDFLQADACTLSADGNYTLDQKEIQVCDLAFKVPFCTKDWESNYLSESLRPGSNVEENYPNGVVDYIFGQMALKISALTERLMFQGDTTASPPDLCDGLQKKLLADATVLDVAVDGTKLHAASTVIGELTKIYNKIPYTLDKSKVKIMINPATASAYKLALAATNPAIYAYNNGDWKLTFIDVEMIIAPGLGDYKAIAADPMNLIYATDLANDENQIEFIVDPLNKKTAYAVGSFKWGVNYAVGAEIVYYN
jgi:hypothetical protein